MTNENGPRTHERAEIVALDAIKPHPANPRRGDVALIAESLRTWGQYKPIVVNRRNDMIVVGHHTWLAAKSLGWDDISAVYVDLNEPAHMKILLLDNRSSDIADWDDAGLVAALQSLPDLVDTGFSDVDLEVLIASLGMGDEADADDIEHSHGSNGDVKFQAGTLSWTVPRSDWEWFEAGLAEKVGKDHQNQVAELRKRLGV